MQLKPLIFLISTLTVSTTSFAHEMTQQQFDKMLNEALANDPTILMKGIKTVQIYANEQKRQQEAAKIAHLQDELYHGKNTPVHNRLGEVSLVEFFDYRCGACKANMKTMKTIIQDYPNVRVVFKDVSILGPESEKLAKVALAVNQIDSTKYPAFHTELMSMSAPSLEKSYKLAKLLDIDTQQLIDVSNSKQIADQLAANNRLFAELGLRGTPTMFVEDTKFGGVTGITELRPVINSYMKN
ncbi:DsbA family protein (plasmid) [Vibrio sp. SS-MA-C1-2]|uniref:DsbA family protein n=1 Tax=Vibrio sp. SS-MA-C1-2 TaxID=2908646 RepID=UPI001F1ECCEC|nr:DsbA family protein [Vibrio sp. SS-MA-C1-2]UJF20263.1 DsbA family protein [Vibrio sp. SS-MA-C1-2]